MLIVGGCFLAACDKLPADQATNKNHAPAEPPPVPVLAAEVVAKDVPHNLTAIGIVESRLTVNVKPQVGGNLVGVHFKEGQDVNQGDLLFTIDKSSYEANVSKAQGTLAKDQAQLKNAQAELERYKPLLKSKVVSKDDYDRVLANFEQQTGQVAEDKGALEFARLQIQYCTITSPIAGRTGNLMVDVGNYITPSTNTPLVVINQIAPIDVSFSVPEEDLAEISRRLHEQDKLKVAATIPGDAANPIEGALTFVDNQVDRQTGTIGLKATFENKDRRLWPGLYVNVALNLGTLRAVLLVPTQAVQTGQSGQYVIVVKPDSGIEIRPVKPGLEVDGQTVVLEGLTAGETIVTDGQLRLRPTSKVTIRPSLGAASASASDSTSTSTEATADRPGKGGGT